MTIDHKPKKYIQGYIRTVHERHASLGKAGIWAHRSSWEEALSLDRVKEKESKKKTGTYSSGTCHGSTGSPSALSEEDSKGGHDGSRGEQGSSQRY